MKSTGIWNTIGIMFSGLGVGWLVGLSVSPVLHIIVASLLTLVVAVVSTIAGIQLDPSRDSDDEDKVETVAKAKSEAEAHSDSPRRRSIRTKISIAPVTFLVVAVVLGSVLGLLARTNEWFGPNLSTITKRWSGPTGLTSQQVSLRVFDQLYPTPSEDNGKIDSRKSPPPPKSDQEGEDVSQSQNPNEGVLYIGVPSAEYVQFKVADDQDLRRLMLASSNTRVRRFAGRCSDPHALRAAVDDFLCPESK